MVFRSRRATHGTKTPRHYVIKLDQPGTESTKDHVESLLKVTQSPRADPRLIRQEIFLVRFIDVKEKRMIDHFEIILLQWCSLDIYEKRSQNHEQKNLLINEERRDTRRI